MKYLYLYGRHYRVRILREFLARQSILFTHFATMSIFITRKDNTYQTTPIMKTMLHVWGVCGDVFEVFTAFGVC